MPNPPCTCRVAYDGSGSLPRIVHGPCHPAVDAEERQRNVKQLVDALRRCADGAFLIASRNELRNIAKDALAAWDAPAP